MSVDDTEDSTPESTIGVGMGGSCPSCRAPIDLGQEFCLECGSPIRFTPKAKKKKSTGPAPVAASNKGFPWVPFLIVLALLAGGIGIALLDSDSSSSSKDKKTKTEDALPEITSATEATTSGTLTTTLQDCDPARPLSAGAATTPSTTATSGTETIPSIDPNTGIATTSPATGDIPSTTPTTGSTTVTVDQNGNLCPTTTSPTTTAATTATNTTATTSTSATIVVNGTWPQGMSGWTVRVNQTTNSTTAQSDATELRTLGFADSGVVNGNDFSSLCDGQFIVFSGFFGTQAEAQDRLDQILAKQPNFNGMQATQVANTSSATNCNPTR